MGSTRRQRYTQTREMWYTLSMEAGTRAELDILKDSMIDSEGTRPYVA
jgi:hypothetical protein